MVSHLTVLLIVLFCIALFFFSITKKGIANTNLPKDCCRKLARIFQKIVLLLLPPMIIFLALTTFTAAQKKFLSVFHQKQPETYTAESICVWEDDIYSGKVDPASLEQMTKNEEPDTRILSQQESKDLPEQEILPAPELNAEDPEIMQATKVPMASYDYSILEFFGSCSFTETITPDNLDSMESMYQDYWNTKSFWDLLDMEDTNSNTVQEALNQIAQFDSDVKYNSSTLAAADYYRDSKDKLFMYTYDAENYTYLELSAISAESAAELENVITSGGYQTLFDYIYMAVTGFSCILDHEYQPYISGSEADVKYRIGKMLCKPAINLQDLTFSETCYSLCSSYVVLKDAFNQSMPDDRYYMELAYHYLLVTSNIFKFMEPEERVEIYQEAINAYCRFRDYGQSDSQNPVYAAHQEDAEEIVEYLNSQLIADGLYEVRKDYSTVPPSIP